MNITELTKLLHAKINVATSTQEILALSKAIERLNIGSVRTVSTYASLSGLSVLDGEVVFVEDENVLYYNYFGAWFKISGPTTLRVWGWGANGFGQLADATNTVKSSPVSIVSSITNWIQVSAGGFHSLGLRADGTARSWGYNNGGPLGDGTIGNKSTPAAVVGGFTDWSQLSAGGGHSLGLRSSGTAWAWGRNISGALGDGTVTSRLSPVSVVGGFTDWVKLSAGQAHSVGLRANGTVWAWGYNLHGQLGDNTTVSTSSPVSVVGGFADWILVDSASGSISGGHNVGIRANGSAWAWGRNSNGQLGDNTIVNKSSPVAVVGGFTDWTQVSAGGSHTLGLRTNGTVWSWGFNGTGELGDGTTTSRSSPVSVIGGFTDWVEAHAGLDHSSALRSNGTAWTWGRNNNGQIGDGTNTYRSSPVSVVGGFSDWLQLDSSGTFNLAIRSA